MVWGVEDIHTRELVHTQNTTFCFSKIDFTDISYLAMLHLELILKICSL